MEEAQDQPNELTPLLEVNRGTLANFPEDTDDMAEIMAVQFAKPTSRQIIASTHGKTFPTLSHQFLFHIPNTVAYINLTSAEQLVANIMTRQNQP